MANNKEPRLTTLERTDYPAFVKELKLLGIKASEWEKFKLTIAKEITNARASTAITGVRKSTIPALSIKQLAHEIGVTGSAIRSYEAGGRMPIIFNLFMIGKATGKRLKISYE